ncbi:MAG: DUF4402 domain-containing protein [Bacteroidales bacterium]
MQIFRKRIIFIITAALLSVLAASVNAQPNPPRPIILTADNSFPLAFGALTPGAGGGTVTISPGGTRTSTGDVILLNLGYSYSSAVFYIRANPGTVISLMISSPVTLVRGGGGTLTLNVGGTQPVSPFVTTLPWQQRTTLLVGGTLSIGPVGMNPPGQYNGTFSVTCIQE